MGVVFRVDDVFERKVQRVGFVKRDFEHARGDLHRASEAARRRIEYGEVRRLDVAGGGDRLRDRAGRGVVALDDERGLIVFVDVAELFIELLDARERARRSRAQREEAARLRDDP